MKDLLKNKTVLSFVGGIAATIAGAKIGRASCRERV